MVRFPNLIGEMAKREISKKTVANSIGVCNKALQNRLVGKVPFTWEEVKKIHRDFFPDILPDDLFATSEEIDSNHILTEEPPVA